MKRFIHIIFIVLFPSLLNGQMFPLSDHYQYNALYINPAYAGCQEALSATILYRNQWVGFEDAPINQMVSVHAPFYNNRIGLGILIENNSIGIFKETSMMGNYAYRRELYKGTFSLGLGFGVTFYNAGWNKLEASDPDDMELTNNPTKAVLPNFSLGTYYYTEKYYIGISLPMFLSHEIDQNTGRFDIRNNFSDYNYFLTGGYETDLGPRMKLLPSLLIKYHPDHMIQIDYNLQISFIDRIYAGIGYRNSNTLVGMLQCQINHQLRMAYSYDFDFGSIGRYKNGSHEIGLNYVFRYERKVMGPRQY